MPALQSQSVSSCPPEPDPLATFYSPSQRGGIQGWEGLGARIAVEPWLVSTWINSGQSGTGPFPILPSYGQGTKAHKNFSDGALRCAAE